MKRPGKLIGLIVATSVAAIAPALAADAAEGREIVIEIRKFKFVPKAPVIRRGDVIVWINKDIVPHSATADDGSWDSGRINAGATGRMVVDRELFDRYHCTYHRAMTARLEMKSGK